jgi:hypothetical protein
MKSLLIRFTRWCLTQATHYDSPGYPLAARVFDWLGGRAANLHMRLS